MGGADRALEAGAAINPYSQKLRPYAFYALALLMAVQLLNYVDRQIIAIVGERVKEDLSLTDAQLGFLYGTAFSVLYGVAGIALGRISDGVNRTRLMAVGLAFWSSMTALCGGAANFAQLSAARIGVGVGEGSCSPVTNSLAVDYFPARHRAMAISGLLFGSFVGMGASLFIGGLVLQNWGSVCRLFPFGGACGLADWQAAFLAVGLPGIGVAALIATLKDPPRPGRKRDIPLGEMIAREVSAAVPPLTLLGLAKAGGRRAFRQNLTLLAILVAAAVALSMLAGDWPQWAGMGIAVYTVWSWAHSLKLRDPPLFMLTYGCPTFNLALTTCAINSCINGTVKIWVAAYAIRKLGASPVDAGLYLGLGLAASAGIGVIVGGWLTDLWKQKDRRAPLWMALIGLIGPIPALLVMMSTPDFGVFIVAFFAFATISQCYGGGFGALTQDLVLPRMRGSGAAAFSIVAVLITAVVGPYWTGKVSTLTGSLTAGLLSLLILAPVAVVTALLCARRLPHETEAARLARARQYGEAA